MACPYECDNAECRGFIDHMEVVGQIAAPSDRQMAAWLRELEYRRAVMAAMERDED